MKGNGVNKSARMWCYYSDRETVVAALSADGKSDEEIAIALRISIPRVKLIKNTIIAKAKTYIRGC